MTELDKWQQREVKRHAADNGVTEAEALEALHPTVAPEVAAEGEQAPAAAKVSARK